VGIVISFIMDLPPGASVVGVNLVVFIVFSAVSFLRQRGVA